MRRDHYIKTRVPEHTKQRVQDAARQRLLTESIWLRQVIEAELQRAPATPASAPTLPEESAPTGRRIAVRLLPGDARLLKERATARRTAPATYVSILVRAHLRDLTPLPTDDLRSFLKVATAMREATRALLIANSKSWEAGHRPE